jgi:hypothetical protein
MDNLYGWYSNINFNVIDYGYDYGDGLKII